MTRSSPSEVTVGRKRGTLLHRLSVSVLGLILTLLLVWLLGFVVRDIDRLEGPDIQTFLDQHVEKALTDRRTELAKQKDDLEIRLGELREARKVLEASRRDSETAVSVLREMRSSSSQGEMQLSPELQRALTENLDFFLEEQREFRSLNSQISEATESLRVTEAERRALEERIAIAREPADQEYRAAWQRDQYLRASWKLAFLIPIFLGAAVWSLLKRSSAFRSIPFALFAASSWKVGSVIHEHFPLGVFKYIAIGTSIAVVLVFLVRLILTRVAPKPDWLLRQYREAYRKNVCPVCADPIRSAAGATRSPKEALTSLPVDTPTSCPACGQRLFEDCASCGSLRHSLLPFCRACGASSSTSTTEGAPELV